MTSGMSAKGSALGASAPRAVLLRSVPRLRGPPETGSRSQPQPRNRHERPRTAGGPGHRPQEAGIGGPRGPSPRHRRRERARPALLVRAHPHSRHRLRRADRPARPHRAAHPRPRARRAARRPAQRPDGATAPQRARSHAARPPDGAAAVAGLLEAIRADREGSAMLTVAHPRRAPGRGGGDRAPDACGRHQPGRAGPAPHSRAAGRAVRRPRAHAQADARRHVHQDRRHARHRAGGE